MLRNLMVENQWTEIAGITHTGIEQITIVHDQQNDQEAVKVFRGYNFHANIFTR